jgi:hypothetical protein
MTIEWKKLPQFASQVVNHGARCHVFADGRPVCHVGRSRPIGEFVTVHSPTLGTKCFACFTWLRKRSGLSTR